MKYTALMLAGLCMVITFSCNTVQPLSSSWVAPAYVSKAPYQKIMVLVQTSDATLRRQAEDALRTVLARAGQQAIPMYALMPESTVISRDLVANTAKLNNADALLVVGSPQTNTSYTHTPQVNASVGVPVSMGFAHIWLGTNIPLAGGTKAIQKVSVEARFYTSAAAGEQWRGAFTTKKNPNAQATVAQMVTMIAQKMQADKLF